MQSCWQFDRLLKRERVLFESNAFMSKEKHFPIFHILLLIFSIFSLILGALSLSCVLVYGSQMEGSIEDLLLSNDICEDCTIMKKWFQVIFVWIDIMVAILSIVNLYSILNNWPNSYIVRLSSVQSSSVNKMKYGSITTDSIVFTMRPQYRRKETVRAFAYEITMPSMSDTEVFV